MDDSNMTTFQRFYVTPLGTLALIGLVELFNDYDWFTASLAIPIGAIVAGLFFSSLHGNMIAAFFITVYAIISLDYDIVRASQVIILAFGTAVVGGMAVRQLRREVRARVLLEEEAKQIEEINGNLNLLEHAEKTLEDLERGWNVLKPEARLRQVIAAHKDLNEVLMHVKGWQVLWQQRKALIDEHAKWRSNQ